MFAEYRDGEELGKHAGTVIVCRVPDEGHSANCGSLPSVGKDLLFKGEAEKL